MKVKEENEKVGFKLSIQKTKIMASGPITSWEKDGETVADFYFYYYYYLFIYFFCSKICRRLMQPWNKKTLTPWRKSYDKPRQHIKKQRYPFADKGLYSQSSGFSSSHVWMWELDHKEGWPPKNLWFPIVVLKKTWESFGQQGDQINQS